MERDGKGGSDLFFSKDEIAVALTWLIKIVTLSVFDTLNQLEVLS